MTIRGVDVSKWQGEINWTALKADIDFALMKATEGTSYIDPDFIRNRNACRQLGIPHGFYHYIDVQDPIREAEHFVSVCKREDGEGQSLDFEGNILHANAPAQWAKTWLDKVHELTKNRPIPYMSGSVSNEFNWRPIVKEGYGLWVASWGSGKPETGEWPFWAFWQTGDTGHVAGIAGDVDTDQFDGKLSALMAYFANDGDGSTPTHRPTPPAQHPKPTKQPIPGFYEVKAGDTLIGIARKYGTTVAEISRLNKIVNVNMIRVGERLRIAGAAPNPKPVVHHPVSDSTKAYVVKSGDTLSGIAEKHHETLQQLISKNKGHLRNPDLIFPGEHIYV